MPPRVLAVQLNHRILGEVQPIEGESQKVFTFSLDNAGRGMPQLDVPMPMQLSVLTGDVHSWIRDHCDVISSEAEDLWWNLTKKLHELATTQPELFVDPAAVELLFRGR
jgi:hypothetical protein